MKTLLSILPAISLCIMLSSCSDFLVETPQTEVDAESVYNSLNASKASLAGCYAKLTAYNYTGFNYFHVLSVTSGVGVSIKANDVNLTTMNILPSDVNMTNAYKGMYEAVNSANDIIDGMKDSQLQPVSERNRILGEAYFIRALTYFNLVRMFGPVPLIKAPVTDYATSQVGRTPVSDVYTLIESDLSEAFTLLPEPSAKVTGHPHKYAAKALLAKVYLTRAGNDETSTYWQSAYDAAKDVYDNGGYILVRPYANLFGSPHKNNAESIFEVQYSSAVNSGRSTETTFPLGHTLMSNIAAEGKSWGKTRPTQRMFDMFDAEDPRREVSFVYTRYTNMFDSAKDIILYPTQKKAGTNAGLKYKQGDSEYAAWKKYYDPDMTASATNANFVFYRYADLLLVLAEAANEIDSDDAATYLNMVLDRARDANGDGTIDPLTEIYPLPFTGDKAAMRERIFRERLKELTGECDEWFTVRRRGASYLRTIMEEHNAAVDAWYALQKINTLPKFVYKYEVTDETVQKNLLFPYPSDEINRNGKISQDEQNYGY